MKRLLVTGAGGQLGRALAALAPGRFELHATTRADLDITDLGAVRAAFDRIEPDVLINAAAYTAVDRAESEPERATAINVEGVRNLATAARETGARFLHVSTDFVFDGIANRPYTPEDVTRPLGAYGQSKRDGELAAHDATSGTATIVRTAWVYGPGGHNFVRTMLRVMQEQAQVTVVADQVGSPTHTYGIAELLLALAEHDLGCGEILHWTDAGVASWFDLAESVRLLASERWPDRQWAEVIPIPTADYPTAAERPRYSVLDTTHARALTGLAARSWQSRLRTSLLFDRDALWLPATVDSV